MRVVSQRWGALNASRTRERRFYLRIETVPGDDDRDVYICSHDDIDIEEAGVVLLAKPRSHPKIRTQNLNPDEGRSTIGTMTFDAIDIGGSLTNEMRTALLSNSVGWRQKRVQYFSGFRQLAAEDYELEDTQLIDRVTFSRGVYQFRCRDIQREMRKRIFEPLVARLAQPVAIDDDTIEIFFNPGFEAVQHGASYSDAAGADVLYVQIDDEIIRVPSSGIGSTQLTDCVRGVLGTRAAAHTTDENASVARGKEVTEVIYLEMPVPKLVYALLTGFLIGQEGTLPDHWHLGINAGTYVRLTEFQNIGSDLYVQANDTLGMIERYILDGAEDGKSFIEKEILRKYGLFMPIHADGAIGLRRGQPVLSGSAVVGVLDDSLIVGDVTLTYAMDKVLNEFRIGWNEIGGEPTRFLEIIDSDSVTKWGAAPRIELVARGLVGSRQTDSRVRDIFEGLRDRYSGPPLTCDVTVFSSQSLFEVGDVVRVRTSRVRDFTNALTSTLDRAFEIQGVAKNLSDGTVTYTLFGSSQKAGALPPLENTAALADGFYVSGTNIASMSGVVDEGSELVLPDGITFAGASTVTGAVYYATKDVRLPAGRVANYAQNVQLRIRGVLQIDGEFNGSGAGIAGVADTVVTSGIPNVGDGQPINPIPFATQAGTPGYFGVTQAAGGLIEMVRQRADSTSKYRVGLQSVPGTITQGQVEAIPSLNIQVDDGAIVGVPSDLRGTSGGPGGLRYWTDSRGGINIQINRGGTGGAGGAGLLIVSRGFVFGVSGRIDSSGADGSQGVRDAGNEKPAWSGGGAGGAPGATLILLDGASSPSPVLASGNIIADYGATPEPGDPHNYMPDAWVYQQETRFGPPEVNGAFVEADRVSFFRSGTSGRQAGIAAARFFFLLPPVSPEEDVQDVELANFQVITIDVEEAFATIEDANLTVLVVDVTEVAVTEAYSHANIYTRRTTGDDPDPVFRFQGGADPRLRITLPADGQTYTVRAVPVLINGVEATVGVQETQIVSTPGINRVTASVSYNRQNISVRALNAGAWTPAETTVDGTVEFVGTGGVVATRVIRATRNDSNGTITVASESNSGEATSFSTAGSGTLTVAVTVTHDESGVAAVLNFASVISGTDGTPGSGVTILGELDDVGDLPGGADPGDAYIIDGDLWVWDGADWINAGQIQGPPGADGDDGLSVAELVIYRRAATAPATPTGGSFDFATQVLTPPASWSIGVPAGTDPVYVSRSVAYIVGQSGSFSSFTWSAPVLGFQNGEPGSSVDIIFRRSAAQPLTPAPSSGTPASWYSDVNSVPASASPLWSSVGTRATPTSNWTWQTPVKIEGEDGSDGVDGIDNDALAINPSLSQGNVGWDSSGSLQIVSDPANGLFHEYVFRQTNNSTQTRYNIRKIPVVAGVTRLAATGWVKTSAGATFTAMGWRIGWFDASDTLVGANNLQITAATTAWTLVSGFGTAPAGAVYARLGVRANAKTSGTLYWTEGAIYNIDSIAVNVLLGGVFSDFIEVASTGKIYSGKPTFGSAVAGWFMGRDDGEPGLAIGNSDGSLMFKPSTGPIYSGVILNLSPLTITHTVSNNANGISFGIDSVLNAHKSIVYERELFGTINDHQWILRGDPDDYEVRFEVGASSNMTRDTGYLALNTWYDIDAMSGGAANHRWRYTTGAGQTGTLTGTLTVRKKSSTGITAIAAVSLTLTDT